MLPGRKKPRVLIIDNAADNIASISESLKDKYGVRVATNGKVALEVAGKTIPDIILMNVSIPILNGYETCRRLKKDQRLQDIPILFLTSGIDKENEKRGFALGAADYITMPPSPPILLARIRTHLALKEARNTLLRQNHLLEEKVQQRTRDLSTVKKASIMALAALAEIRDSETGRHLQRSKLYIKKLAEYMGKTEKFRHSLTPEKVKSIVLSSPLHDIGKIGMPDHILLKPGPLSKQEYEMMKKHTILGRDAIMRAEKLIGGAETFLSCAREIIYSHHEKWNGTGYPEGLAGEDIPLPARLMAIVDAYDALTSQRVYKEAVPHEKAVDIIKSDSGTHFDPDVVEAFLALQETFKIISKKYTDYGGCTPIETRCGQQRDPG